MSNAIEFAALVANPYRDWPSRYPGQRAIGYLCSYVPEEIIHAAGFVPIRIMPAGGPATHADAHMQSYTCSLARGCLERALTGELDFLEGVVFAHTCDTMQCLTDVWREGETGLQIADCRLQIDTPAARQSPWIGWVVQPVTLNSPYAKAYLVAELKRFAQSLEEHFGVSITDEALRASITLYNRNRRILAKLHGCSNDLNRSALSAIEIATTGARSCSNDLRRLDLWYITNAAMLMPPEELQVTGSEFPVPTSGGIRLVLSGSTVDDPAILALIQDLGGKVVGDDLCNGERYFDTLVPETGEPWADLAERYLHRIPCPCKHSGLEAREKHLLGLVKDRGATGVIFLLKKFCEPHAWDYPHLAAALKKAGIPHLLLETEATTPIGVVRTRIEAFLEILE